MHITKLCNRLLIGSSILLLSNISLAETLHDHQDKLQQQSVTTQKTMMVTSETQAHANHIREHGGQIFQRTELEHRWIWNPDGQGTLKTELESRIGTDENRLFIKGHIHKAESEQADYDIAALYSRAISDFWDVQAGMRYRYTERQPEQQEQIDVMLGLHGLAPYFFETDAYLYAGKDQQLSFNLKSERDLLVTQKLILQPYIESELVLSDDSKYARKKGLSSLQLGVQTRYEINKRVMPFIDVAYAYEKGREATVWQQETSSEKDWQYGLGLKLIF